MDAEHHQVAANGRMLRRQLEKICSDAVQNQICALLGSKEAPRSYRGQYHNLLRRMSQAALEYTLANNIGPDDFEYEVLRNALALVEGLRDAIPGRSNRSPNFLDDGNPLDLIKADKVPLIDRRSLEGLVGDYLALPYRSEAMDRTLVRCLIAAEMYAFGDEMLNEKTLFGLIPSLLRRSPMKQRHALLAYLSGNFVNYLLFGWWWETLFWFFAVTSTLALPYVWFNQAKERGKVVKLLATMGKLYHEQLPDGPISAYYTRDRANDASRQGVVWPAPLFLLLDDIISRTGRY
jgi:hypothetical protein